jgi:hypothetical protein
LLWRNNTGAEIRLFRAAETNGGTNYLFNLDTAAAQTNFSLNPCYGYVSASQPLDIGTEYRTWGSYAPTSDYYIFCGCSTGNDELVLQVTNEYGGEVGEASVFLNLKDVKQMYERWSVGEYPQTPINIATNCGNGGSPSFSYPYDSTVDSTTPYILYVHGWNMATWEKDRWAETAYKRLYWQGYQGRFGVFRWPANYFVNYGDALLDTANYDNSEWTAWQSGQGLKNLLVAKNIQYPGQVYVMAHSMGNVATGEALREAGGQIVNTYVASQGAISARAYDNTIVQDVPYTLTTPDSEGHYYTNTSPSYFNGVLGAGTFVGYYNPVDWALIGNSITQPTWLYDQSYKPASPYGFGTPTTNDPSGYFEHIVTNISLFFTNDTYEIFGMCAQSYSGALGAETNVGGVFDPDIAVNLNAAPYNFGRLHVGHSAQFRSDNMTRSIYWNQLLSSFKIQP